jgi:DNA-3-methyladenine glycosylase
MVAPALLGARLVRELPEGRVTGRIVEVEAYLGPEDLAAHSARGRTPRNATMFGPPGHLYVYLVYGLHHCANVVCGPASKPEAVLLRAAALEEGIELARKRRGLVDDARLAAGPGNLAAAFGIDRRLDGADVVAGGEIWIEPAAPPPLASVVVRPRVGVGYAGAWAGRPLRFSLAGDPHVSR